ncbi:hypothetical protein ABIB45_004124 [Arthrobacter sp. UYCo732]
MWCPSEEGFAGRVAVFDAVAGGDQPLFPRFDTCFTQSFAGTCQMCCSGGGEVRSGDDGDAAVSQVDEVAYREVPAHFVIPYRRGTLAVDFQGLQLQFQLDLQLRGFLPNAGKPLRVVTPDLPFALCRRPSPMTPECRVQSAWIC